MGNHQSISNEIHNAINCNDSKKLLKYIKKNEEKYIITSVRNPNGHLPETPVINILLNKNLCREVVPYLLKQNPDIHKTYNNVSCMSYMLENDDLSFKLIRITYVKSY